MTSAHRILVPLFLVLSVLPLPACALSGGAIEGQVLEEGTNKPVAQAIVTVKWVGSVSKFVDSQSVCVHVESAHTDEQGRYRTPAWSAPSTVGPAILVSRLIPVFTAYKPAYRQAEKETDFPLYLKPFTGTRGERLAYLKRLEETTRCNVESEKQKVRLPLLKAISDEALILAATKEDRRVVNSLLFVLDTMELGEEKAFSNLDERRKINNE